MGGCEWPPPPLPCAIVTQAISCLEVWEKGKKKFRVGAGALGRRRPERAEARRGLGWPEAVACVLRAPKGAKRASRGRERQVLAALLWGVWKGRGGGGGGSRTPPSGGAEAAAAGAACPVTPARALTGLAFFSAKLPLSFLPAQGRVEFAVLLSFFLTWSAFRSSP